VEPSRSAALQQLPAKTDVHFMSPVRRICHVVWRGNMSDDMMRCFGAREADVRRGGRSMRRGWLRPARRSMQAEILASQGPMSAPVSERLLAPPADAQDGAIQKR